LSRPFSAIPSVYLNIWLEFCFDSLIVAQELDVEGLEWARTEAQTLQRTGDAFHGLVDDLLTSLDDLNRRHVGDISYLLVRVVGTNQYYERKRRQAEEVAANKVTSFFCQARISCSLCEFSRSLLAII
jgi:hypothetical protein